MNSDSGDRVDTKKVMTGRERVLAALNFKAVDRVPVDLGGTLGTGAHVGVIAKLRQALGLDKKGKPVKVVEPYQMLGEVAADLRDMLGIDVVNLPGPKNFFGFENTNWKPWKTFDGTDVLVPGRFDTKPEPGKPEDRDKEAKKSKSGEKARSESYIGKISIPMDGGKYYIEFMLRENDLTEELKKLREEKMKDVLGEKAVEQKVEKKSD